MTGMPTTIVSDLNDTVSNSIPSVSEEEIIPNTKQLTLADILEGYYEDLKDVSGFSAWVMRAWFNPERYTKSPWFSPEITAETVIMHITGNPKFPYSPSQLIEMYKAIPAIQHGLNANGAEKEIVELEEAIYKKGEQTLSAIGAQLGNVSATMVKKIGDGAEEKIKKFYNGVAPDDMSIEEEEDMFELIEDARMHASIDFAAALKSSNGDIKAFFAVLVKNQILSSNEVELISAEEIQGLVMLQSMDADIIEEILVEDLEDDDNIFKTFQNAVSKRVFPPGRRGRPRKANIGI
jgi:gas vesicle protein